MDKGQIYDALGSAIRARREKLEMTQGNLADLVDMSRASVTNIELGRQSVLVDQLYKFAAALRIPVHDLLPAESKLPKRSTEEQLAPDAAAWIERVRRSVS